MAIPKPATNGAGAQNPFLKVEHFRGREKGTLSFLGGREPQGNNAFSDIFVDVTLGGKAYTWGLKADSRNYAALYKRFGANEKKWKGSVNVVIAKGKFINVVGS